MEVLDALPWKVRVTIRIDHIMSDILSGFLQENGPFSWKPGTFLPVANPWSWHKLANIIWYDIYFLEAHVANRQPQG